MSLKKVIKKKKHTHTHTHKNTKTKQKFNEFLVFFLLPKLIIRKEEDKGN